MMPAVAPIAAARPQPIASMRPTGMPQRRADSGFCAAARIASPVLVKRKNRNRKASIASVTPTTPSFQANRARDAVYGYLEAVFAIVSHYKTRRKTNKLLRHAFRFANLPFEKAADPFTAVIRCTSWKRRR
jgi:hypothetical protein